jgi:hypothetical protein
MTTPDPRMHPSGTGAKIVGSTAGVRPGPELMAATTLVGDKVMSSDFADTVDGAKASATIPVACGAFPAQRITLCLS